MTARRRPRTRHDGHFGERLRRLRFQQGLGQTEIAKLTGVPRTTYVDWERGIAVPYPGPHLRAVAGVLRVMPGYLLFGDEEGMHGNR